jgi:hypothetical protein
MDFYFSAFSSAPLLFLSFGSTLFAVPSVFFFSILGPDPPSFGLSQFCGGVLLGCTEILPPLATFLGLQAIVPQEVLVLQVLLILLVAVLLISTASSTTSSTTALLDLRE